MRQIILKIKNICDQFKTLLLNGLLVAVCFTLYGCQPDVCECVPVIEKVLKFKTIFYFKNDSAQLKPDDQIDLAEIALWMAVNPNVKIVVTGYSSSSKGSDGLRYARAMAVKRYISSLYGGLSKRIELDQRNSIGNNTYPKFESSSKARCAIVSIKVSARAWQFPQFVASTE